VVWGGIVFPLEVPIIVLINGHPEILFIRDSQELVESLLIQFRQDDSCITLA